MQINVNACFPFNTEGVLGLLEGMRQPRIVNKKSSPYVSCGKSVFLSSCKDTNQGGSKQYRGWGFLKIKLAECGGLGLGPRCGTSPWGH